MNFLKKNAPLLVIAILILLVSLVFELRVFGSSRPYYSFLIFSLVIIAWVQFEVYFELEKYMNYKLNAIYPFKAKKAAVNRNLIFLVDEIIDIGRSHEAK